MPCSRVIERVERWVYRWEQRWRLDRWVPVIFVERKGRYMFLSADKKQKTFSTETGWFSIDQLLNFSVDIYLFSVLPKTKKCCFPFHQKKWSISMYKLPQKWNMKSKIRKPYLYLILSLQAKYCLQDGQVQIFPLWSMTSICNQLIYIYTIKFTPTNWQIYTLRSLCF